MSKTVSRVLWAIAGVILIACGIWCLDNPAGGLEAASFAVGFFMLVAGIIDIVIFGMGHDTMYGSGWFLVDGILTVILALFLLFNQVFTTLTLPFILSTWMLFSGITRFVNSFDLKNMGVPGWGWFTALGVVLAVLGFVSFMDPVLSLLAINVIVGLFLILQGISAIVRAAFSHRLFR